jgi:hypothetical protein
MNKPEILIGGKYVDERGTLLYNNDFDVSRVKRMYRISNSTQIEYRRWQGHKIECRWFTAVKGETEILAIHIDNWDKPKIDLPVHRFVIKSNEFDILFIPAGFVTSIKSINVSSEVLAMSDYRLGEIKDEFKFPHDYFNMNILVK